MFEKTQACVCTLSMQSSGDSEDKSHKRGGMQWFFPSRSDRSMLSGKSPNVSVSMCAKGQTFCPEGLNLCQKCAATHWFDPQRLTVQQLSLSGWYKHAHTRFWKSEDECRGQKLMLPFLCCKKRKAISWRPERGQEKINLFGQKYKSFCFGSAEINIAGKIDGNDSITKGGYFPNNFNQEECPWTRVPAKKNGNNIPALRSLLEYYFDNFLQFVA